jgi:hypothetical protein
MVYPAPRDPTVLLVDCPMCAPKELGFTFDVLMLCDEVAEKEEKRMRGGPRGLGSYMSRRIC